MAKIATWLKAAVGEMSKLRRVNWFFNARTMYSAPYSLNIEGTVDYKRARDLYYNRDEHYKLGAGFAKPIVNTLAGFMGVPSFVCEDEAAQEEFDKFIDELRSTQQRVHQKNLIDGECFVRLVNLPDNPKLYPENRQGTRLTARIIPPEQIP